MKKRSLPSGPIWAICGSFVSVSLCLCSEPLLAQSAPSLIRKGNEQYRAGDYAEALKTFEEAGKADPDSLEAKFNRGVSAYKSGDLDLAERMFREVDSSAGSPALASAARYNLGVVESHRLRSDPPSDPRAALDRLVRAASLFRGALDLEPGDADAARNLELTRRAIRELRQLIERQQQVQQALQNLRDQLKENQQDQEKAAKQNQRRAEQQQQQQQEQEDQQERAGQDESRQQAQAEQERISERTRQAGEALDQLKEQVRHDGEQSAEDPLEQASRSLSEAKQKQQEAERRLGEGDFDAARREQEQAAEKLREAVERLGGGERQDQPQRPDPSRVDQRQDQESEGEQQPQEQQVQDHREKEGQEVQAPGEEADASTDARLARILDKERRDRELKKEMLRAMQARNKPVDKDW